MSEDERFDWVFSGRVTHRDGLRYSHGTIQ
jgi:hypothetical protein